MESTSSQKYQEIRRGIAEIVGSFCDGTFGDDWEERAHFIEWGEEYKPGKMIDRLMDYLSFKFEEL